MLRRAARSRTYTIVCRNLLQSRSMSGTAQTIPSLPESVDAVVIGGGCVGTSVCLHLQERGLSTLLLEAHQLTAGTTWHTAGMLWRLRPSYVDIELHTHTRDLAYRLEADPDVGVTSWAENGGLFIACNRERLSEYERLGETGARYGIESSILSPAEAKRVHPLLEVGDVYGALHMPSRSASVVYAAIREAADAMQAATGRLIADAGYRAIDSLSAEKNFRHWHADLSNAETPLEAGIGFTVLPKLKRKDKPDFYGRTALEAQRSAGLRKRLVCLVLDDADAPPLHGAESLVRNGERVGLVRSTAFGHTLLRTIVTGYADIPFGESKPLEWLRRGVWGVSSRREGLLSATLHLKAPFDPTNARINGEYNFDVCH